MQRLTTRNFDMCEGCPQGVTCAHYCDVTAPVCQNKAIYDRLVDYEDLGMDPQEIGRKLLDKYIDVPLGLTREALEEEFGKPAVEFYMRRIEKRRAEGKVFYNPLKTIYLWATKDREADRGYYASYRGYARRGKN